MVQTLQVTLMIMQQHAPTNRVIERLMKVIERDESMKEIPPMKTEPMRMR